MNISTDRDKFRALSEEKDVTSLSKGTLISLVKHEKEKPADDMMTSEKLNHQGLFL